MFENRVKLLGLILALAFCSCRSSFPPAKSIETRSAVLAAIAQAIDANNLSEELPIALTRQQREQLKALTFWDSLSPLHPRYYDRIKSTQTRQVERYYLNYTGDISRSELIILPEREFWEPLKLLAQYYSRFGSLPTETSLSVWMLQGALAQKSR
ncbi:MAG: hypothetical protein SFY81_11765 [Verrucomicrobiota bacterium]|nr:hypothetical protein [Verrucomicrobiota bacterium]